MIEVDKCHVDCKYINDYWKNHLIIDQSELITAKNNRTNLEDMDLDKLSIDVSSYEEFKAFVENLEEVNENERTTDKKIKIIKDNTSDDNFFKSKETEPKLFKVNHSKKVHHSKKEYKMIQNNKSFTLKKGNVNKNPKKS